jgi:hypothetical protein
MILKLTEVFKMSSIQEKPWSVHQFEAFRPHMANWVRREVTPHLALSTFNVRRLLIHGQVKVGKREIVEYISLRDYNDPHRHHIFISSFHRKADEIQREELEQHGLKVFSLFSKKKQEEAIEYIEDQLIIPDNRIIIHWDECDYGTGERQTLAKIYRHFRDHEQVFNILYSATPEELLFSNEINRDDEEFVSEFYEEGIVKRYDPPAGYCGAAEFMRQNLVQDAMPFFESTNPHDISLSAQARLILRDAKVVMKETNRKIRVLQDLLDNAEDTENVEEVERLKEELDFIKVRNIIILRISYFNGDDDDDDEDDSDSSASYKAIYPFLRNSKRIPELKDVAIYADKFDVKALESLTNVSCETVKWGKRIWWDNLPKDKLVLIVHDQTSTRSTEWVFHDRLFATHDYRKKITFNTVLQAQLRSAHYMQNYGGFQPIRIYGHLKTFQLCVGQISVVDYLTNEWVVKKVPKSEPPRYRLKNTINCNERLPESLGGELPEKDGYPLELAQRMLLIMGCTNNGGTKMSQRVKGQSKRVPVTNAKFYPCEPENVREVVQQIGLDDDERISPYLLKPNGQRHVFSVANLFRPAHWDEMAGKWRGTLRGNHIFEYEDLENCVAGIRIGKESCRLTVCYNDGQVGLCLRVATGELREVSDLNAYKSMYCIE